jgi:hemolysin activation/secretion protein
MAATKNRKLFFILLFAVSFLFSNTSLVLAQNIPPGAEPGAEAERFREQSERQKQEFEGKALKIPKIEVPQKEEKPSLPGLSFVLKEIKISGSTIFASKELLSIYQDIYTNYYNKEVTLQDMQKIAQKIQDMYDKKGYLTTNVFIPEQDIKDGIIEIRVIEGKMGELKVEGNKYFSTPLIKSYFHSKKNEILNVDTLRKDILRLNQNSGLDVKIIVSPGELPQTSDIILQVKDSFPWHVGIAEDSLGTRLTGKYRTSYTLRCTNLTGNGDTFFEDTLFSRLSFGESVSYTLPLGSNGTKFSVDATYFKMKIGKEFVPSDIIGRTQIYSPRVSWELALREDHQADFLVGMDIKSVIKKQQSIQITDDQLRLPWFGFNFNKQDVHGSTSFSPRFTFGTSEFLGASSRNHPSASRANTGGEFVKYTQSLNRVQRMPLKSYMTLRSQMQIASHTLPSVEQFQIGGAYSVRGYPEGAYLCDTGGYLSADWLFPMYLIPERWMLPKQDMALRYQIQPVIFADAGGGKLKKVLSGEKETQFLAGFGGGLQFNFKGVSLRVEWAKPFGGDKPQAGQGKSTFSLIFSSEI